MSQDSLISSIASVLASKLNSDALSSSNIKEFILEAYMSCEDIENSLREDLIYFVKNDPACKYYSTPILFYKGYQGWTTDFIPKVLQESIDNKYFDELIPVSGNDGIHWANELAKKEGIITGVSGGSTFAIAVDVAKRAAPNSNILCMLPDSAERYMSSILFDHIDSEMNDDEIQILNSC